MYSQESNWKHRKGSCGEGVGVYHVQPTVQLEAARKGSCGTDSCEELVNRLTCFNPGPNMNSNVSCETYNSGSQGGAAKVPKATDI